MQKISTKALQDVQRDQFSRQLNVPSLMPLDEYRQLYASVMRRGADALGSWIERACQLRGLAKPTTAVVLGSGLGGLVRQVEAVGELSFAEAGLPSPSADGHAGRFVLGVLDERTILLQSGRLHCYEHWHPAVVALPVRMQALAGLRTFVLTNAAGSIDPSVKVGHVVVLSGDRGAEGYSPSGGLYDDSECKGPFGPKFYSVNQSYDSSLRAKFIECATKLSIPVHQGVYQFMLGPRFEQVGEIREFVRLRKQAIAEGDSEYAVIVVGMSTAPEAAALAQLRADQRFASIQTLGISNVTNLAAGIGGSEPSSEDVLLSAPLGGGRIVQVLREMLRKPDQAQ